MIGIGKKKPPPIRSLIGEGMTVKGTVYFTEGMRIDGRVEGDVIAAGEAHSILVISEKARVIGKVMAAHVIINGEVEGPIVCQEMLELQPKARITGDIRYDVLEMHPGALVDGELRSLKSADKPQLKLAASNDA
jgi:cytoskeletal protein CcmA (bactofilin family)